MGQNWLDAMKKLEELKKKDRYRSRGSGSIGA
jgi:hypothetical protein